MSVYPHPRLCIPLHLCQYSSHGLPRHVPVCASLFVCTVETHQYLSKVLLICLSSFVYSCLCLYLVSMFMLITIFEYSSLSPSSLPCLCALVLFTVNLIRPICLPDCLHLSPSVYTLYLYHLTLSICFHCCLPKSSGYNPSFITLLTPVCPCLPGFFFCHMFNLTRLIPLTIKFGLNIK